MPLNLFRRLETGDTTISGDLSVCAKVHRQSPVNHTLVLLKHHRYRGPTAVQAATNEPVPGVLWLDAGMSVWAWAHASHSRGTLPEGFWKR